MSCYNKSLALARRQKQKPTRQILKALGAEVNKQIPISAYRHSYTQIGAVLGMDRRNTYHVVMLALGKLVWKLRETVQEDPLQ